MHSTHADVHNFVRHHHWVDQGARGLVIGTGLGLTLWAIIGWGLWAVLA